MILRKNLVMKRITRSVIGFKIFELSDTVSIHVTINIFAPIMEFTALEKARAKRRLSQVLVEDAESFASSVL